MSLSDFFKQELSEKFQIPESAIKRVSKKKFDSFIVREFQIKTLNKKLTTYSSKYEEDESSEVVDYQLIENNETQLSLDKLKEKIVEILKNQKGAISSLFGESELPLNFNEPIFHNISAWDMSNFSENEVSFCLNMDFLEYQGETSWDEDTIVLFAKISKDGSQVLKVWCEG